MIIVSQDKNLLVNFNNISNINIEKNYNESIKEKDITFDIYAYAVASGMIRIGKYKTEKRAIQVLEEIINKYMEYSSLKNSSEDIRQVFVIPKTYIMPKE